jgi:hypothetical protein
MTTLLASTIGDRQCVPMECVRRYRCEAAGSRSGSEVTRSQPVGATFSMRTACGEKVPSLRWIAAASLTFDISYVVVGCAIASV